MIKFLLKLSNLHWFLEVTNSNLQISRQIFLLIIIIEKMLRNFEFAFDFAIEFTLFGIGYDFV